MFSYVLRACTIRYQDTRDKVRGEIWHVLTKHYCLNLPTLLSEILVARALKALLSWSLSRGRNTFPRGISGTVTGKELRWWVLNSVATQDTSD